jgi:hypothetical protein
MSLHPLCYVKMKISVCHSAFESDAYFFSSFAKVENVITKALNLATEKGLSWDQRISKMSVWDDLTGEPLEGKYFLIRYYPENGCATIRVHVDDYTLRGVYSMDV